MTENVQYRRKTEGRTNYKRRLALLVSRRYRAVVRKSLKYVQVQIVEYQPDGDVILVSAHSRELKKLGFDYAQSNIMTSYLTGLLCGKKALAKGIKDAILDIGLQTPHTGGKIFAAAKGLVDSGMEVPVDPKAFPSNDRISGKHIEDYAKSGKEFTGYANAKIDVKNLTKVFAVVKQNIMK
jgi:large subunit ribosomal protein L18